MSDYPIEDIEYYNYSNLEEVLNKPINEEVVNGNFFYNSILQTPISIKILEDDGDFISIPCLSSQMKEISQKYSITTLDKELNKVYKVQSDYIAVYDTTWMETITEQVKIGLGIEKSETVDYRFTKMCIASGEKCESNEELEALQKEVEEYGEGEEEEEEDSGEYDEEDYIATVILTLPSRHQGGEINFQFNGSKGTHKTNTDYKTAQEFNYLALYSDCKYGIEPTITGYHVYLIYKLYKTSGTKYSAELLEQRRQSLNSTTQLSREIITNLNQRGIGSKLIYVLEGDYETSTNLSFTDLKRNDKVVADKLLSITNKSSSNITVFLAHLEILRDYEDDYIFKVNGFIDPFNKPVHLVEDITWSSDFSYFFPYGCLDEAEPYSVKRSGTLRSRGGKAKIRYSKQVLFICNSHQLLNIFNSQGLKRSSLEYLFNRLKTESGNVETDNIKGANLILNLLKTTESNDPYIDYAIKKYTPSQRDYINKKLKK